MDLFDSECLAQRAPLFQDASTEGAAAGRPIGELEETIGHAARYLHRVTMLDSLPDRHLTWTSCPSNC